MIKSHQVLKNILIIFFSSNVDCIVGILKIIFNTYLASIDYGLKTKTNHIHSKSTPNPKKSISFREFEIMVNHPQNTQDLFDF